MLDQLARIPPQQERCTPYLSLMWGCESHINKAGIVTKAVAVIVVYIAKNVNRK